MMQHQVVLCAALSKQSLKKLKFLGRCFVETIQFSVIRTLLMLLICALVLSACGNGSGDVEGSADLSQISAATDGSDNTIVQASDEQTPTDAQIRDEQTPAEEGTCNELKSDGVTDGLYGLCVAFCEAQDWASEDTPITEEELEALESGSPSGHILANYNKKKQETDPAMPCILVEEPCPCWSADELASIDGYAASDGTSLNYFCEGVAGGIARRIRERPPEHFATAWNYIDPNFPTGSWHRCEYRDDQASPQIWRALEVSQGTLTVEEAAECLAQVETACDAAGL
jgi:hypothetical protein